MIKKVGIIGCGSMGTAIIKGILEKNLLEHSRCVKVFDKDYNKMFELCEKYGVDIYGGEKALSWNADIVILAVKPNIVKDVLKEVSGSGKAIISIAAGIGTETLKAGLSDSERVLRIMPNIPLVAGEGAVVLAAKQSNLTEEEMEFVKTIFSSLGKVFETDEENMNAVTGVSGSGPAYIYAFIEAMARAGEANGLPYDLALETSVQTAIGAAKMILSSEQTVPELIEDVCSPNGTTMEAMSVFEDCGLSDIVLNAVTAATQRSKELSN